jgi:hypothetical protein
MGMGWCACDLPLTLALSPLKRGEGIRSAAASPLELTSTFVRGKMGATSAFSPFDGEKVPAGG